MTALKLKVTLMGTVFCLTPFIAFALQTKAVGGQAPILLPEKPVAATVEDKVSDNVDISKDAKKTHLAPYTVLDESQYPLISKLETVVFGTPKPTSPIEERLDALEQEIFHAKYNDMSLFDRTQKLKLTILGPNELIQEQNSLALNSTMVPLLNPPVKEMANHEPAELTFFEIAAQDPQNQFVIDEQELPKYALELINKARAQLNFPAFSEDKVALLMARKHIGDLCNRRVVSHISRDGENPDLRYTNLGGTGAIVENVVSVSLPRAKQRQYSRAMVANVLKHLIERQDDRESLLSPDATGFGFAIQILSEQHRAIACAEVSTTHGNIDAMPSGIKVGDKIEVSGHVEQPYKFARITVAWEGISKELPSGADETDEALPYFPPLDFVGYRHKGEHDYSGVTTALKMGCLVGVIAGGVFIPPVALAAPLVLMTPDPATEPRPVSDIPIHGGVKTEGEHFRGKISISNSGKPGIYYITVWATLGKSPKQIPISRRAMIITESNDNRDKRAQHET